MIYDLTRMSLWSMFNKEHKMSGDWHVVYENTRCIY